jgi:hypothetical protein
MYLHNKENYSQYINDLIDQDRLVNADQKIIDARIFEHQHEIDRLKKLKQAPQVNKDRVHEILDRWLLKFNEWRNDDTTDQSAYMWIKNRVIPELRAAGCKDLDPRAVLNMFVSGRIDE